MSALTCKRQKPITSPPWKRHLLKGHGMRKTTDPAGRQAGSRGSVSPPPDESGSPFNFLLESRFQSWTEPHAIGLHCSGCGTDKYCVFIVSACKAVIPVMEEGYMRHSSPKFKHPYQWSPPLSLNGKLCNTDPSTRTKPSNLRSKQVGKCG